MIEGLTTAGAGIVAAGWIGKKVLGPTLELMGSQLRDVYKRGATKIAEKAARKIPNINDSGQTNLRVTHEAFQSSSFTDEEILNLA